MRPCPSCGGDCGHTKKKGCQYKAGESEWVGLTDDEVFEIANFCRGQNIFVLAKELSNKLKEKNHGNS